MAPRKRHRPNPDDVTAKQPSATQSQDSRPRPAHAAVASEDASPSSRPMPRHLPANNDSQESVRKSQSWYGSWPRPPKAAASISIAKENIHGDTFRSRKADLTRFESRSVDDTASIRSKLGESAAASDQAKASMSQTDSNPPNSELVQEAAAAKQNEVITSSAKVDDNKSTPNPNGTSSDVAKPEPEPEPTNPPQEIPPATPTKPQPGWLGWLTRTPAAAVEPVQEEQPEQPEPARPSTPPAQIIITSPTAQSEPRQPATSWFGLWNTPTPQAMADDSEKKPTDHVQGTDVDVVMEDAPAAAPPSAQAAQPQEPAPKAGSTWAFWSKATPVQKGKPSAQEAGEIAVIGEGSEAHPLPMRENNVSAEPDNKDKGKAKDSKSTWRKSKRPRPVSMDESIPPSPASSQLHLPEPSSGKADQSDAESRKSTTKTEISSKSAAESETSAKQSPNLLLPSFASTYQMKDNPSILKQITNFLLRTSQPPANHVFRVQEPPKIKRALAIGVHGLFPATYLRPMMGQPTGTSLRFASLCADGIRRWADAHGCPDCEIEKVALEGEGRIGDRVENLWKLLLNWIDQIRKADLIIMASHSQGVPVSLILLDKLIDLGIITQAKIGVCAMAGVALGPFPDYKSSFLMGSAAELWDFGNPQSANSQRFEAALKRVLDYGARVTFIGSIDDQVVPMESAVYSPASHPYIYRAVFIDGRIHAPDFIAHLVGFALKLRNLGVSDHGLVRELSLALAGSLYSGEGHSRLYYDDAVYDLAIAHALETTSVPQPTPCHVAHRTVPTATPTGAAPALASANPYVLPWIMRGLLEEDFVKTELSAETEELLRQFDDWKPSNKALKDVKYRLEAVRSKL
ncbi:hypothetical protein ISF_02084 [Cordyceps fumosorosea ARSEF 2679]|uniref:YMC020W-like alpha/beta hydrolase domain-containing protein n=1 Tax=Cordyceps fumosorosea (strain ARSEF 2679) TaxID=1081104 RepID=A0A168CLR1_CORFA|nr:hypothetical protein ISF_02084 [Cordyceps fumosorosea ARSEF 2679]OAA71533.1 hypothetical protein ISF_02084 [Cordyceps fumosorosea ARSEF 2679]